jgi:hypothetical protein
MSYLFLHVLLLWHLELHNIPAFKHLHVFLMHPDLQVHFKNPCPVPIDCSLAACRTLISVSKSTEPRSKMLDVHRGNWFLENDSFKRPYLVASLYCCVSVLISVTTHIRFLGSPLPLLTLGTGNVTLLPTVTGWRTWLPLATILSACLSRFSWLRWLSL